MFRSVMLRFVLPVAFASCVVAYFGLPYIERLLAEWFRSDVELRSQLVMHSMEEPLAELVGKGGDSRSDARLRSYLGKVTADERLLELQARLADNLALLRESQEFDQAVHGLTAAIHMLTARHSQLSKAA